MVNALTQRLTKGLNKVNTKLAGILAVAGIGTATTYCDVDVNTVMNNTTTLVFKILTWGGIIISVVGVVMLGKAIMDSSAGQSQPGALGKALGVLVLGILMLAAKSILTAIGVTSTIS